MYDGYYSIAGIYDKLNADIDYERWSDFIAACFDRFLPEDPDIVLDLACGTGRMTFPLADRGFDMIGIDGSADMLAEAYNKSYDRMEAAEKEGRSAPQPLFLQQDMRAFELYGTVDATVCCLDSMNYLTGDGDLDKCLACIHLYLAPGGLLIFDVNSPYKFEHVYGNNAYILEDEGAFCGWQNDYDPETRLCRFDLSVFEETENGGYTRIDEQQTERCYTEDELRTALDRAGFNLCGIFADFDFSAPTPTTERWYVVARTRKTGDWYLSK
jgi:SAM-dependent methyltransferase